MIKIGPFAFTTRLPPAGYVRAFGPVLVRCTHQGKHVVRGSSALSEGERLLLRATPGDLYWECVDCGFRKRIR